MADLTLTHPVVVNGITYPYVAVQFMVNPRFENGGHINSAVFNFYPYRVLPNGTKEELPRDTSQPPAVPSLILGDATAAAGRNPAVLGKAFAGILGVIQQYMIDAGI